MDFLSSAFDLTRWGWKVFPLAKGQKVPAVSKKDGGHGCLGATNDEEIIADWAKRYPTANIGIACGEPSRIIVIDLDPRNGSQKAMEGFRSRGMVFPATVVAQTANGGQHLYYAFEDGLKNSKSELAPGIDVKTTGGYVVAPPSVLQGGRKYEWLNSPLGEFLPRLPRWVVAMLKPKPKPLMPTTSTSLSAPHDTQRLVEFAAKAGEGNRNNYLFWAAMRAAESGGWTSQVEDALVAAGMQSGLDRDEAEKAVKSAKKKAGVK